MLVFVSSPQSADLCRQVFSFVHAQVTFFHQGSDLLRDLEPTMKTMAAQVLNPKPVSSREAANGGGDVTGLVSPPSALSALRRKFRKEKRAGEHAPAGAAEGQSATTSLPARNVQNWCQS